MLNLILFITMYPVLFIIFFVLKIQYNQDDNHLFSVSIEKVKEDTESSKPYDDSVPDHKAPSIDDSKTESKFPAGAILLSVLVVAGVVVIIVWKKKRSE